jgi:FtsZ-interacting cell division protein YlmF
VRPLALVRAPRLEVLVVVPRDFDDARRIADRPKAGGTVIVDLQDSGYELSRPLTDFCSGLACALEAALQAVGEQAVLLAPRTIEVSSVTSGALQEGRFFNQA